MTESNEKALAILGQQYSNFINLSEHWDFFRGLANYAKTVETLAPTKQIVEALEKQQEVSRKLYDQMNSRAFKELGQTAAKMMEIAQKVAKDYEPVMRAVKELQDHLNGKILSSNRLYGIENSIFDVARSLKENGFADAIKTYEDNQRRMKNIYGNYTFSASYEKLPEIRKKFERQEQIEPWGAWHNLPFAKRMVIEPEVVIDEVKAEVKADPTREWNLLNLLGVAGEMEKIRHAEEPMSDNDIIYFRVKDFRSYAQRFHSFITTELIKSADSNAPLNFDVTSSILTFQGKEILIARSKNTDPHYLLQTLFADLKKLWNYDEVATDWKTDFDKTKWKRFYNAAYKVNQKIAEKTTIKDFLEATKKTVSVNRKYLD